MTLGVGTITSDAVVERLFVTKLDRLILCFFVGPRHTNEALLVHPLTGTFNSFELPPEKYFREANDKYQAARQRAPADPHTTQPALDELLTDATTMLRLVLDFIENSIPTCGLTIVPRMQLTAVPFHALPVADKRLIDIVADITYAPSLGIITEQTAMGPWPDQDAGVTMLESTATPAFIGAARQIAAARSLRSTLDPPPAKAISAIAATEGADILIGCHGTFSAGRPYESTLKVRRGEPLTVAELAGSLALPKSRCLLLAACESGVVRSTVGGEYLGFGGTLLSAGVRSVIASNWQVNPFPTAILLGHFLSALTAGHRPASTLKAAQRAVRAMTKHDAASWVETYLPEFAAEGVLSALSDAPFAHPDNWAGFFAAGCH